MKWAGGKARILTFWWRPGLDKIASFDLSEMMSCCFLWMASKVLEKVSSDAVFGSPNMPKCQILWSISFPLSWTTLSFSMIVFYIDDHWLKWHCFNQHNSLLPLAQRRFVFVKVGYSPHSDELDNSNPISDVSQILSNSNGGEKLWWPTEIVFEKISLFSISGKTDFRLFVKYSNSFLQNNIYLPNSEDSLYTQGLPL